MSLTYERIAKGTPAYESTKSLYYLEFPDRSVEFDFDQFMDVLEKISADVFTYSLDGEYAGYSITIPGAIHVYYYMIAVSPAMRSKGIGGQIATTVRNMYPDKALTGLVEADDPSPEGRRTMERRLSFHSRIGLKETEYHLHVHSREYLIISTAATFDPADMKDIAEVLVTELNGPTDDWSIERKKR